MPSFRTLSNIWNNIKEIELRPIQEAAVREVRIALVGAPGSGRHTLAGQLRSDPHRPGVRTQSPLLILELEAPEPAARADLIILVLDATRAEFAAEQALSQRWINAGKKVIVFWNKLDLLPEGQGAPLLESLEAAGFYFGSAVDSQHLLKELVPLVLRLLPDLHLALGRQFPLFRLAIAHQLINDTCLSNAAYAFSTGLAEVVPVLDLPLNITDMIVLTKAQAFLVYRVGLLLGFSTRWQDYIGEFGSVIGGGFIWRQLARSLVGLIPIWGLVPKVAVAYAGTYAVGHTVLQWYLTGKQITRKQLNALYRQALASGKQNAQRLVSGFSRLRLPRKKARQLPASGETAASIEETSAPPELLPPVEAFKNCSYCGRSSAGDAVFCQYCGEKLTS